MRCARAVRALLSLAAVSTVAAGPGPCSKCLNHNITLTGLEINNTNTLHSTHIEDELYSEVEKASLSNDKLSATCNKHNSVEEVEQSGNKTENVCDCDSPSRIKKFSKILSTGCVKLCSMKTVSHGNKQLDKEVRIFSKNDKIGKSLDESETLKLKDLTVFEPWLASFKKVADDENSVFGREELLKKLKDSAMCRQKEQYNRQLLRPAASERGDILHSMIETHHSIMANIPSRQHAAYDFNTKLSASSQGLATMKTAESQQYSQVALPPPRPLSLFSPQPVNHGQGKVPDQIRNENTRLQKTCGTGSGDMSACPSNTEDCTRKNCTLRESMAQYSKLYNKTLLNAITRNNNLFSFLKSMDSGRTYSLPKRPPTTLIRQTTKKQQNIIEPPVKDDLTTKVLQNIIEPPGRDDLTTKLLQHRQKKLTTHLTKRNFEQDNNIDNTDSPMLWLKRKMQNPFVPYSAPPHQNIEELSNEIKDINEKSPSILISTGLKTNLFSTTVSSRRKNFWDKVDIIRNYKTVTPNGLPDGNFSVYKLMKKIANQIEIDITTAENTQSDKHAKTITTITRVPKIKDVNDNSAMSRASKQNKSYISLESHLNNGTQYSTNLFVPIIASNKTNIKSTDLSMDKGTFLKQNCESQNKSLENTENDDDFDKYAKKCSTNINIEITTFKSTNKSNNTARKIIFPDHSVGDGKSELESDNFNKWKNKIENKIETHNLQNTSTNRKTDEYLLKDVITRVLDVLKIKSHYEYNTESITTKTTPIPFTINTIYDLPISNNSKIKKIFLKATNASDFKNFNQLNLINSMEDISVTSYPTTISNSKAILPLKLFPTQKKIRTQTVEKLSNVLLNQPEFKIENRSGEIFTDNQEAFITKVECTLKSNAASVSTDWIKPTNVFLVYLNRAVEKSKMQPKNEKLKLNDVIARTRTSRERELNVRHHPNNDGNSSINMNEVNFHDFIEGAHLTSEQKIGAQPSVGVTNSPTSQCEMCSDEKPFSQGETSSFSEVTKDVPGTDLEFGELLLQN